MQKNINFFSEDIEFQIPQPDNIFKWLNEVASSEGKNITELNYIFCSDAYLLDINQKHLNHDTYTDIITFQYDYDIVEGDIFISIERVTENADKYNVSSISELNRVMVHGLLHMLGYKDKTSNEKKLMTNKENYYLSQLNCF